MVEKENRRKIEKKMIEKFMFWKKVLVRNG